MSWIGLKTTNLKNRTQVVGFQTTLSDLSSGVPQGSILGPLLFVPFINDFPDAMTQCNLLMYADDAVIFFAHRDSVVIEKALNEKLIIVNDWTQRNFLFLKKRKTCDIWNQRQDFSSC